MHALCSVPDYTKTLVPMLLDNCSCKFYSRYPMPRPKTMVPMLTPKALVPMLIPKLWFPCSRVGTFCTRPPKTRQCYGRFVLKENISSRWLSYAFPRNSMGTRKHKAFVGWGERFSNPNILPATTVGVRTSPQPMGIYYCCRCEFIRTTVGENLTHLCE